MATDVQTKRVLDNASTADANNAEPPTKKQKSNWSLTCGDCSLSKGRNEFSSRQRNRKRRDGMPRCKSCVVALEQQRKADPSTQKPITCEVCSVPKAPQKFAPASDTVCLKCILKTVPRECQKCHVSKPNIAFLSRKESPLGRLMGKTQHMSMSDIQKFLQNEKQVCLDCNKIIEKEPTEVAKEETSIAVEPLQSIKEETPTTVTPLKSAKENTEIEEQVEEQPPASNLAFYDRASAVPKLVYTQDKPASLTGVYDIVFHQGVCTDHESENRVTKGTATLTETESGKLSGTIEFDEKMQELSCGVVMYHANFDVAGELKDTEEMPEYGWRCDMEVTLHKSSIADDYCLEEVSASLKCVKERAALPRIDHEEVDNKNLNRIELKTLQEAEQMVKDHTGDKAPPAFFVEPNDLTLSIGWCNEMHCYVATECILRRRP